MVAMLPAGLPKNLEKKFTAKKDALVKAGLPKELADSVAKYSFLAPVFSLIDVSQSVSESLETMISTYYLIGDALRLDWLGELISGVAPTNSWESRLRASAIDDLAWRQRVLAKKLLEETRSQKGLSKRVDAWFQSNAFAISRTKSVFARLRAEKTPDLAMITVALRELKRLA